MTQFPNLRRAILGPLELRVIRAVHALGADAYGVSIALQIEKADGVFDSTGAIYTTLERLRSKGLLSSSEGEPSPHRGGRRKRYYRLTHDGHMSLNLAISMTDILDARTLPDGFANPLRS